MANGHDTTSVAPVTARLRHAEVMEAAITSRSRGQRGQLWASALLFVLLMLAIWLGNLGAFTLVQFMPFSVMFALGPYLPVVLPALLCLFAVALTLRIDQRAGESRYLSHLAAIGAPLEQDGTYEVTPDALVLSTDRIVLTPRWAAIDTVEKGRKGWVVSADQLHFLIPFDAFPNDEAQRPLLAAITDRLTPEARARSREAVEFADTLPLHGSPGALPAPNAAPAAAVSTDDAVREALVASGWATIEQGTWAASVIYARIARYGFHRWAYPLLAGVTGALIGTLAVLFAVSVLPVDLYLGHQAAVTWGGFLVTIGFATAGVVWGGGRTALVAAKQWREGLNLRGVPDQIEATWRLTSAALAYRTGRFAGEAPYAAIHQVLRDGEYWLIAVDALTLCIPDPAFASPDDAHAFIATLLDRIDPAARARSVKLDEIA